MPDWITHLGTTYLATAAAARLGPRLGRALDVRHVLAGALLPDATRFTIILVDVLDWPAIPTFTYFIPFHSLLIAGLLAGALALVLPAGGSSRRAFGLVMAGAGLHFIMDDLEGPFGCGSTTFYPLYFGRPDGGWSSEGRLATLWLVVSAMALGAAFVQSRQWPPLALRLAPRRLLAALALVAVAGLLPLLFRQHMIDSNAYYLAFVTRPAAFEGQQVELCFSEVVAAEPPAVEEFDRSFVLQLDPAPPVGSWVSVRGIYQHGVIRPSLLVRHQGFSDITLSVLAAITFIFLIFRSGGKV